MIARAKHLRQTLGAIAARQQQQEPQDLARVGATSA
jgi:hypothetical protein